MGCIAFTPLAQGLLTGKYIAGVPPTEGHGQQILVFPTLSTNKRRACQGALTALPKRRGQSLAQMALAWVFGVIRA